MLEFNQFLSTLSEDPGCFMHNVDTALADCKLKLNCLNNDALSNLPKELIAEIDKIGLPRNIKLEVP